MDVLGAFLLFCFVLFCLGGGGLWGAEPFRTFVGRKDVVTFYRIVQIRTVLAI